jgi:methylase of polypeptide subunit release factors
VSRASEAGLPELDAAALERLRSLIACKRAGVPLAHLTGRQSFMGLEFLAGPSALIPRRETEILGRAALAKIRCMAGQAGFAGAAHGDGLTAGGAPERAQDTGRGFFRLVRQRGPEALDFGKQGRVRRGDGKVLHRRH